METAEMKVREAMQSKVVTVPLKSRVSDAAAMMEKNDIGCIIIADKGKPVGIVTERDMCFRVVAKNKKPDKILVEEIMSKSIRTVTPETTLKQASRMMVKHKIRRLPVTDGKSLVGIITNTDLLAVSPATIEILEELSRMKTGGRHIGKSPEKGTCEMCGYHMVHLYEVDGNYICEACRDDMLGGRTY